MTKIATTLAYAGGFALLAATAQSATLIDSSFDLNPSTTVNTAGLADWGYFVPGAGYTANMTTGTAVNFDALDWDNGGTLEPATVSNATPSIGEVFYTPTDASSGTTNTTYGFTFGGNEAGQLIGNIGTSEEIFSMKFNDLGAGTHTMSFYIGASNSSRAIDIDYFVYEDDDAELSPTLFSSGEVSGNFGSVDGSNQRIVYSLTFDTETANTDLVFNLGSAGGGGNAFTMGGYTVEAVPEASTFALIGLSGLFLLRRRSR